MKRTVIIAAAVLAAFLGGCCSHKKCAKDHDQAQKSKIEARKALDEMDKEIEKNVEK
jgi:protein involved in sex pheromone biosynthesis